MAVRSIEPWKEPISAGSDTSGAKLAPAHAFQYASLRRGSSPRVVNDCIGTMTLTLRRELALEVRQRAVAGQHLGDTGVRFPLLADGCEELAILQLDAIHRDIHVRHVDLLLLAVDQVVVARDVGAVVADVAEEGAERPVVVEGQ